MLAETYVHIYGLGTVIVILFGYLLRKYLRKK
jgi:hypothetical protein